MRTLDRAGQTLNAGALRQELERGYRPRWSVRLVDSGFHVDHVHPQGWFSSAFYVALPEKEEDSAFSEDGRAGWLSFGENRELVPDLEAFRWVEPRAGTLALFPSITWHGTRPFGRGERMTVAFDIALPG